MAVQIGTAANNEKEWVMKIALHSCLAVLLATGGLAGASSALAASPSPASGAIACDGVQQNKAACLRERGAAAEAARRGGLTNPDAMTLQRNALARCSRQPPSDQSACEARVLGTGSTTVDGSVLGGGLIRQTETPVQ